MKTSKSAPIFLYMRWCYRGEWFVTNLSHHPLMWQSFRSLIVAATKHRSRTFAAYRSSIVFYSLSLLSYLLCNYFRLKRTIAKPSIIGEHRFRIRVVFRHKEQRPPELKMDRQESCLVLVQSPIKSCNCTTYRISLYSLTCKGEYHFDVIIVISHLICCLQLRIFKDAFKRISVQVQRQSNWKKNLTTFNIIVLHNWRYLSLLKQECR